MGFARGEPPATTPPPTGTGSAGRGGPYHRTEDLVSKVSVLSFKV